MMSESSTGKLTWFTLLLIAIVFFVPSFPGMIFSQLTYSLMDEAGFALYAQEKGLWGSISYLHEIYSQPSWQRNHFVGLFLDQFVVWAWPSPNALRVLRLVEAVSLSVLFLAVLNQYSNRLGKRIKVLFFLSILSFFSLFFINPLFFSSIYEFEGCLLSFAVFYLLTYTRTSLKWVGFAFIPLLWFTKETMILPAFAILAFSLLSQKILKGHAHKLTSPQKWTALGFLVGTVVTTLVFAGNRTSDYASQHPETPLSLLPEYLLKSLTAFPTLIPFILITLFAIMIIAQTVTKNELWQESRSAIVVSAFFGILACGYGAMLYPWGKESWTSHYYLPVKLMGFLSLSLFGTVLFNHLWPRIRNYTYAFAAVAALLVLALAWNGRFFHKKVNYHVLKSHEVLQLNSLITELSENYRTKPTFFTYFYERATRIVENEIVLGTTRKKYDYDVFYEKSKLLDCWQAKQCKLIVLDEDAVDSEVDTLFKNDSSLLIHKAANFRVILRN